MAEESEDGPLMLSATDVLKPPPLRIAKIGQGLVLPRSVPVKSLIGGAAGIVLLLPFALVGATLGGLQVLVFFIVVGAAIGGFIVQWEPQKGETLLTVLGVRAKSRMRQQRIMIDGEMMSLSIGVARLTRLAEGDVRLFPGAVDVVAGTVDERGVIRNAKNRNLEAPHLGQSAGATPFPMEPPHVDVLPTSVGSAKKRERLMMPDDTTSTGGFDAAAAQAYTDTPSDLSTAPYPPQQAALPHPVNTETSHTGRLLMPDMNVNAVEDTRSGHQSTQGLSDLQQDTHAVTDQPGNATTVPQSKARKSKLVLPD